MRKSEQKKKLVEELANLYASIDVIRLHDFSDSKDSKDWLAEVAAILKNLDESDYQEFMRLRKSLYPLVERRTRISAANEIDGFVRHKVAEYKRYDFSDLDKAPEQKEEGPIGIANAEENNIFNNNQFFGLGIGIQDRGKNTVATGNKFINHAHSERLDSWYQRWWGLIIVGVIIVILGTLLTNTFGLTKP